MSNLDKHLQFGLLVFRFWGQSPYFCEEHRDGLVEELAPKLVIF